MRPVHLMSQYERKEHLEMSLTNAEFMLRMEADISTGRGWSDTRKAAALKVIPEWEKRVSDLKTTLKAYP